MKQENPILRFFKKFVLLIWDIILRIVFSIRDLFLGIWASFKGIGKFFVNFGKRFKNSSIHTKIGHVVMGYGNFVRKQFVKGFLFLAIQVLFILFMIASPKVNGVPLGGESIVNFFTLGEEEGMKLSKMGNFTQNFDPILAYPMDITAKEAIDNYKGTINQINRSNSLIDAIEELKIKPNDKFVIQENDLKDENNKYVYDNKVYDKLVVDNRYGTNDIYGYSSHAFVNNEDNSINLTMSSPYTIWFKSDTPLDLTKEQVKITYSDRDNTISVPFPESHKPNLGIYSYKDNSEENGYLYFILIETPTNPSLDDYLDTSVLPEELLDENNWPRNTQARTKVTIENSDGGFNGNEMMLFSYSTNYVNSEVDNSFLMMLFGITTFAIIAIFICVYILSINSSYKTDQDVLEGKKPTNFLYDLKTLLDSRFHLTLLTPAILFLVILTIVPTLLMILIAFTDLNTDTAQTGLSLINWTGLDNFVDLFTGGTGSRIAKEVGQNFIPVLGWTLSWAIIATLSCYFGGIFLALLINKKDVKGKKVWRTIFILTIAVPQFITLLIMKNLLKDSGPINGLLEWLGLGKVDFLAQSSKGVTSLWDKGVWTARGTVLVINLYIGIPYTMLMTSGILMNIPADLYEAATIDGANKFQMFRKITLPYVIFVTTPYLISSFIGNITSFNTIFLTTGGGPALTGKGNIAGSTDILVTWLYKMTIDETIYNAGSIIGILTFIITASLTLICYRNSKAYKEEDTFQ